MNRYRLAAFSMLCIVAIKAAIGGVYKCVDPQGRVGYSDKPCQFMADGAKQLDLPESHVSQNKVNETAGPIKSNVAAGARDPARPLARAAGQTDSLTRAINSLPRQTAVVDAEKQSDQEIAGTLIKQEIRTRGKVESLARAIGALRKLTGIADAERRITEAFEQLARRKPGRPNPSLRKRPEIKSGRP